MLRLVIAVGLILLHTVPSGAVEIHPDLPYLEGPDAVPDRHRLDLYLPEGAEPVPALLWIHGGAWAFGHRADERGLAERLAAAGIAVASMDHRTSPATWADPNRTEGVQHPAHVQDVARAFAWLRAHAEKHGLDPDRLYVGGYSSGAHLSALLATDGRYLREAGLSPGALRGAVPVAGAYDLPAYYEAHVTGNGREMADSHVLGVFGPESGLLAASPHHYTADASTPMLVISETDTYDYTRLFEDFVAGTERDDIRFLHVTDRNHASLQQSLRDDPDDPTRAAIAEFVLGGSRE